MARQLECRQRSTADLRAEDFRPLSYLSLTECPDDPESAVIAGLTDNLSFSYPPDRLCKQRRSPFYVTHRGAQQQFELGAEKGERADILLHHPLSCRTAIQDLAQHLLQRDQAEKLLRVSGKQRLLPVRQVHNPVMHPDGQRFAADRADIPEFPALGRVKTDIAVNMTVRVILPLFRKELHCPLEAAPAVSTDRIPHEEIINPGVEEVGLSSELRWR